MKTDTDIKELEKVLYHLDLGISVAINTRQKLLEIIEGIRNGPIK